jgi:hypothetical protein
MRHTLLFILSSNYSGSHYLSLLLGSHSSGTHLGEVKNLVKPKHQEATTAATESTRYCLLCGSNRECIMLHDLRRLASGALDPELFRHTGSPFLGDSFRKRQCTERHLNGDCECSLCPSVTRRALARFSPYPPVSRAAAAMAVPLTPQPERGHCGVMAPSHLTARALVAPDMSVAAGLIVPTLSRSGERESYRSPPDPRCAR